MLNLNNKMLCLFHNNSFIKEAYIGSSQILGFVKTLSYNSDDERVSCSGYDGSNFNSNGYLIYNAVCSKLTCGFINIWEPKGSYDLVDIYIKEIGTDKQLYKYSVSVSQYSSLSNFTLKFTLYDANDNQLKTTSWTTDYGFGRTMDIFTYDFTTDQWIFQFSEGNQGGNTISYEIKTKYKPCYVQIYNKSNRNDTRCINAKVLIQS